MTASGVRNFMRRVGCEPPLPGRPCIEPEQSAVDGVDERADFDGNVDRQEVLVEAVEVDLFDVSRRFVQRQQPLAHRKPCGRPDRAAATTK